MKCLSCRNFLRYRQLGVEDFLIYDDRSVDGSTDFLLEQSDCTVVTGPYEFDSNFGVTPRGSPKRLRLHKGVGSTQSLKTSPIDAWFVPPPGNSKETPPCRQPT
jgi:hypothetical protein